MSNEIAKQDQQAIRSYASGHDLMSIISFGDALVKTGFLPESVKTGAQAAAIILTGRELGIPEMQSLRSINIVKGKPVLAADLMLGLFQRDGGRVKWIETNANRAEIELTRKDGTSAKFAFSMQDAKQAGLSGKDIWGKYPAAMLRARVITSALRAFAPDSGFAGMYDPEEFDVEPANYSEVQPAEAPAVQDKPVTIIPKRLPIGVICDRFSNADSAVNVEKAIQWIADNIDSYEPDDVQKMNSSLVKAVVKLIHQSEAVEDVRGWEDWVDEQKENGTWTNEERKPIRVAISVCKTKFPKPVTQTEPEQRADDLSELAPDQPGLFDTGDATSAFLNR